MSQTAPIRIAVVGVGQIAKVQHLPEIVASPRFALAALVSPLPLEPPDAAVPVFESLDALIASEVAVDAVALCTPPAIRYRLAAAALRAGWHVLLEKPPTTTAAELADLAELAKAGGLALFTAWHSLFAAGVDEARRLIASHGARSMRIQWREDVEKWHPGVDWFFRAGGFGCFDAGINAFSIALSVMDAPLFFREAELDIPEGLQAPVAARVRFATPALEDGFTAEHDWDHLGGGEQWDIDWTLGDGSTLSLSRGGAALALNGEMRVDAADREYAGLYQRFAELVALGKIETWSRPGELVTDVLAYGTRRTIRRRRPPQ